MEEIPISVYSLKEATAKLSWLSRRCNFPASNMDYYTILDLVTIELANRCSHATEEVNSRDLEGPFVIGTGRPA